MNNEKKLKDRIALVTGASFEIGRGIAMSLGECGATVYLTARTLRESEQTIYKSGPGGVSLEETAERVEELGGTAIPIKCDHRDDVQVKSVFKRLEAEFGRLEILVNNAWAGYFRLRTQRYPWWFAKFWEHPIDIWDDMQTVGVRSAWVCCVLGAPLLLEGKSPIIVNLSQQSATGYQYNVPYGVSKAATDKLTADTAVDFEENKVTTVSLYPGWVEPIEFSKPKSESPQFVGRAVAALAIDDGKLKKSGKAFSTIDLAEEYRFTDVDGTVPDRFPIEFGRNIKGPWE